ncbi:MAG: hypothetical protein U0441_32670 [Polyangiaceae bacterium]
MKFDIQPGKGVGSLLFGMTPDEASAEAGPAETTRVLRYPGMTKTELRWSYKKGIHIVFSQPPESARLVELGFWKACRTLSYQGVRVFQAQDRLEVVRKMAADDPDPMELSSFLLFLKLGISLSGFHDGRENDIAVTVFEPGRWDEHLPRMKPYKLP